MKKKCIRACWENEAQTCKKQKSKNETIRQSIELFHTLADKVKVIINRNKSSDHDKNKEMK